MDEMKIAVRYYTKTGNTKRIAEAVAKAAGVEALPISVPVSEPVEILFLGNSYYAFTIDPEVRAFVRSLDKDKIGKIVNFGSAALMNSTWKRSRLRRIKSGYLWTSVSSTAKANSSRSTRAGRMKKT